MFHKPHTKRRSIFRKPHHKNRSIFRKPENDHGRELTENMKKKGEMKSPLEKATPQQAVVPARDGMPRATPNLGGARMY